MATTRRTGCLPTPSKPDDTGKPFPAPVTLPIPYAEPATVYAGLLDCAGDGEASTSILLDGGFDGGGDNAYIAIDPVSLIEVTGSALRVDGAERKGAPFDIIADVLARHAVTPVPGLPPFQGGLAGYWGYELGGHLERLPQPKPTSHRPPDMHLGLFDTVIAFDCRRRSAWVIAHDFGTTSERLSANHRATALANRIAELADPVPVDWRSSSSVTPVISPAEYKAAVQRTVDYIYAGDIIQANITQAFHADQPDGLSGFDLYRRLKSLTPAPYAAYVNLPDGSYIASASPERFLKLDTDGRVNTKPIKGTRPRAVDATEDLALKADLQASIKDRAENLMIVDLLRNDLSRVCLPGTVQVPKLFDIESFAAVHHLVSTVEGQLRADAGPADLLAASFPGGSVTGAPKIRAMEIIHELELAPRGPYCGSIGWIGFSGAMESSIVIRTLVGVGGRIMAQAGCGIVADSDPEAEFNECMDKADALIRAIEGRGI